MIVKKGYFLPISVFLMIVFMTSAATAAQGSESSIVGKWRIYISMNCKDINETTIISFNPDGTLIYADGETGTWDQEGNATRWFHNHEYEKDGNSVTCRQKFTGNMGMGSDDKMDIMSGSMFCEGLEFGSCWNAVRVGSRDDRGN